MAAYPHLSAARISLPHVQALLRSLLLADRQGIFSLAGPRKIARTVVYSNHHGMRLVETLRTRPRRVQNQRQQTPWGQTMYLGNGQGRQTENRSKGR
jgi:hypothetical protein